MVLLCERRELRQYVVEFKQRQRQMKLEKNDLIGWMTKNKRAAGAARSSTQNKINFQI